MKQKLLKHKETDLVVEVVAEDGEYFWVRRAYGNDVTPWTAPKEYWEEFQELPQVGDIWGVGGGVDYRVIGVDEARNQCHYVLAGKWHDGEDAVVAPGSVQLSPAPEVLVFTRELPEGLLTLRERRSS